MNGDEEIACDVCPSEDCTAGYHNCDLCKWDFCLECYRKALTETSEIAASETASQRDHNADMRMEDCDLGAGEDIEFQREPNSQFKPDLLTTIRKNQLMSEAKQLGLNCGPQKEKKRDNKAVDKEQEKQNKMEKESQRSGESNISGISRSTNGRFEGKYKVGDKTASGAFIKEVVETDWNFIEKDKKGNKFYQCLKCEKKEVRGHHRSVHSCKQ